MHTLRSTVVLLGEDVLVRYEGEIIPAIEGKNILINNVWYRITEAALYCETLENYSLAIFVKDGK